MVLSKVLMSPDKRPHKTGIKNTAADGTFTQYIFVDDFSEGTAKPCSNRHRKAHFRSRQYLFRQNAFHALAQDVFGSRAPQFHMLRQTGRELDKLMIEKRNPTLYRSSHAHLILFHQQFLQIGFCIAIQQTVKQGRSICLAEYVVYDRVRIEVVNASPSLWSQQIVLHKAREDSEVIEVHALDVRRKRQECAQ